MNEVNLEKQFDSIIYNALYDCFSMHVENPILENIKSSFIKILHEHKVELLEEYLISASQWLYKACCIENDVTYTEDRNEAFKGILERNKCIAFAYKTITGKDIGTSEISDWLS